MTMADILLFSFIEFGTLVGEDLDAGNLRLCRWRSRMALHPSALITA